MLSELPNSAYNPFEWIEYCFPSLIHEGLRPKQINNTSIGVRWGIWCLHFEEYRSDNEPLVNESDAPSRVIFWRRVGRTDIPKGWHRTHGLIGQVYIGYHILSANYELKWRQTAQQRRRLWYRKFLNKQYEIVPLNFLDFCTAFASSTVAKEIPTLELDKLRQRLKAGVEIYTWGARRISDGKILAGLASFESPKNHASEYSCGFYLEEGRRDSLMIGLIDHWFSESLQKGRKILHLGTFQAPGETWKRGTGISSFKAQFATNYLLFQPALWRFVSKSK